MFVEDARLPQDVVRKQYSDTRDALCCLNCGFDWDFDPTVQDSIGRPLYVLVMHDCKVDGDLSFSTICPASLQADISLPVHFQQG